MPKGLEKGAPNALGLADCHIHTSNFSSDAVDTAETMVRAALKKGVSYLAITDHLDLKPDGSLPSRLNELPAYRRALTALKEKYRDQLELAAGIEIGFVPQHAARIAALLDGLAFDYIINSVHEVDGEDCYFPAYFQGKTKARAYCGYFEAVLASLDAPYPYHCVGHLGYVERRSPYPDPAAHYGEFAETLDAVLEKIIRKKKIIELNTNTYGGSFPWLPNAGILSRYKELGGERVAFGSDAHQKARIGDKYKEAAEFLKGMGFKGFTVISDGNEMLTDFDANI